MDIISQNRLFKFLIFILIILNLVSISVFWLLHNKPQNDKTENPKNKPIEFNKVKDILNKELNLSTIQLHQVDSLIAKYKEFASLYKDSIHIFHRRINQEIVERSNLNIDNAFDSLGIMKAKLDKEAYYFFDALYNICNDNQKDKYKELYKELSRIMAPGPPQNKKNN